MYRNTKLGLLAALPAALFAVGVAAQNVPADAASRPSMFAHLLQKMDSNGDGRISESEFLAAATARFKSIDTANKGSVDAATLAGSAAATERLQHHADFLVRRLDTAGAGYITKDEVLAAAQKRFARLDRNGDGRLTPDELALPRAHRGANAAAAQPEDSDRAAKRAAFAQKRFDKLDANHDGVVTQDEYLAAAATRFQHLDVQGTGQVTANEIVSSPQAAERAAHAAAHIVKRLDTNGDGVVSQDEYLAAAKKRFAHLDRNGDGFIDDDEMPAHRWGHGHHAAAAGS